MNQQLDPQSTAAAAALGGFFIVMMFFTFAISIFVIACHWKIFSKAGKPGWACIIPIYSSIVFCEIIGKPGWWWLLALIPIVNIYVFIVMVHGLSRSFGNDIGYTLGLIFLPIEFMPMLAFGGSTYQGPVYAQPGASLPPAVA
jgi:hypothetical protein